MARPVNFIYCHFCGKSVSTGFRAVPTDTPDRGVIIRAIIICPECIATHIAFKEGSPPRPDMALVIPPAPLPLDEPVYPREDRCRHCGAHIGTILSPAGETFALGICGDCAAGTGRA